MRLLYKHFILLIVFLFSSLGSTSVFAAPPTFAIAFSPSTLGPSSTSTMTYTIDNSAEAAGVSALTFSNTLPTGMLISNPSNASTTCVNGTYSAASGGNSITFTDYRLGVGATCTFQLDITSSTPGTHTNTTGALSTSVGPVNAASADLTIDAARPGFSSAFSPSTTTPNTVSTLTYTIDNTQNGSAANLLTFTNTLPAGMTVALNPNASTTCGTSTLVATPNTDSFSASLASVVANSSCTVSFNVTASATGTYFNKSGELSQNGSNPSGFTTTELSVETPFIYADFPTVASPGSSVTLSYTINNLDRSNAASDITFTNDLNATLSGLAATSLPADDFCGTGSTLTGASTLTIAGANLAPEGSCTFEVTVLIPSNAAAGSYTNSTSTINLTLGSATTKPAISNVLVIKKAPTLTALFIDDPVSAGDDVTLRYVLTNTDSVNAVTAISFTENYDDVLAGTTVKTLPNANTCGTGSTFTSNTNSIVNWLQVSGANLVASESCTFDLILTIPLGTTPNRYAFTTNNASSTITGDTVYSLAATDELVIVSAPSLSLDILEGAVSPGSTLTANFTLDYSANATADSTGVGFTVDLNSALPGMTSTTSSQSDVCGSGSTFSGTSLLTLSGATLTPGTNCTFSVTLQTPADATPSTITTTSSTITATTASTAVNHKAATDTFIISGLSITKTFVQNPALAGGTNTLRYTITNAASALAATSIAFTDSLTNVISSMSAIALPSIPCNGSSTITGTTYLSFSGGELQPGASCTFDVPILIPTGASTGTYNSATSSMSATVGGSNTVSSPASDNLTIESLTVLLSTSASNPTEVSPIPVTINFSRPVTNFVASDLGITNGSTSNFTGSGNTYTVDITPTADGTVSIDLPANLVDDAVNGTVKNPAATQLSLTYTAAITPTPSAIISAPSISKTNTGPITYTVTYSDAETINLTTANISLNKVGTDATINVTNGATSTPTVTLSNISGDGSIGFSINAESARNGVNFAPIIGPSSLVTIDNTNPTVTISDVVPDSFNAAFTATATFNEAVTGFIVTDLVASNATLTNFSATSASVYTVLVTPTSDGTVSLNVAADVATDSAGNGNTLATTLTTNYDTALPTLTLSGASAQSNAAFTATATFNEAVTGFIVTDVVASNASLSNFSATSATVYTVLVTPTSDGAVSLNVAADVATDNAGNGNTLATTLTTTYDATLPTITLSGATAQNNAPFTVTTTFSEDVTGFTLTDIAVTNATLSNFSATSASVYTTLVTPVNEGPLTLNVLANSAFDTVGNGNIVAQQFNELIIPIISLKSNLSTVSETEGSNTILTVETAITAGADIIINLTYSGSAINGVDYNGVPSITIPAGQSTASTPLTVIADSDIEDTENIIVDINSVTGGLSNSAIEKDKQQKIISIIDDDSTLLTLKSSATNIIEENGTSILTATLDKVTFEPVTIMLSYSGSATSGVDFITPAISITIPSGDTSGSIAINVISDSIEELDETIIVDIIEISGGKTNENTAQQQIITIINDDNETTNDSATTNEDNEIQIDVLSNDISIGGALNPASVMIQSQAQDGLTSINTSNGVITYVPNADFNGSDQFFYTVTNLNGLISEPTVVTVTINSINDAPVAINDTAIVTEDNIVFINVLANDSDVDNAIEINSDSFVISQQASHGQATIVNDQVKYEPIADFFGSDIFSYSVKDSSGAISNIATVSVNISGANDTPITVADIGSTDEDIPIKLSVLTNDSDIDGQIDPGSLAIIMLPSNGTVNIEADGTLLYIPNLNFFGNDTFTYTVKDNGDAVSKDTLVTVSVNASNDAPIAHDDIAILQEDSSFDINVAGNDTDIDSELNIASLSIVIPPTNGSVVLNDNMLRYSPTENFNNSDSFSYTIEDIEGKVSNIATVDITVHPVNDLPVANNDVVSTLEDHTITIDLLANDQDIDGTLNTETITLHNPPEKGVIEINSNTGEATYIPNNNFHGNDSFTYTVKDNEGGISNTATVMVAINAVNDVPVISGVPQLRVLVDENYTFTPILFDDDGDSLEISVSNLPSWLNVNTATGELTGSPEFNDIGTYQNILMQVNDGKSTVELTEFSIEVLPDNDADGIPDADDDDDDNDGMTDEFEVANNFNPFNSNDATEDSDNDGLNNLNEQLQGSNPKLDDQAPIFELPTPIIINATSLFTEISDITPPIAIDGLDGNSLVSLEGEASRILMSGRHYLTWFSIDIAGNRSEVKQQIDIHPLISLSKDQLIGEGSKGEIQVLLNGVAPEYPLSVSLNVTGSADTNDHDLIAHTITFEEGEIKKNIIFQVTNDNQEEGEEQINVNLVGSGNFSNQNQHTTTIIEENAAPLVLLTASQNDVSTLIIDKSSGLVSFNIVVNDPNTEDTHTTKWQFSKNILPVSEFDLNSKIDPFNLLPGIYTVSVDISDNGVPLASTTASLTFRVVDGFPSLSEQDSDGDGISDLSEGWGDDDQDGQPNYLDTISISNIVNLSVGDGVEFLIEADPGLKVVLGERALFNGAGAKLVLDKLPEELTLPTDGGFKINEYVDFIINDLPMIGQSVNIVLPQRQAIPDNAVYRKFNTSWYTFIENTRNGLMSAPGKEGECPSPGSTLFRDGLNSGDWCVQMTIEDGGPNDADGLANGSIKDPGGVSVYTENRGGGSLGLSLLLLISLLIYRVAINSNVNFNKGRVKIT